VLVDHHHQGDELEGDELADGPAQGPAEGVA